MSPFAVTVSETPLSNLCHVWLWIYRVMYTYVIGCSITIKIFSLSNIIFKSQLASYQTIHSGSLLPLLLFLTFSLKYFCTVIFQPSNSEDAEQSEGNCYIWPLLQYIIWLFLLIFCRILQLFYWLWFLFFLLHYLLHFVFSTLVSRFKNDSGKF